MTPSPTNEMIDRLDDAAEAAWARGSTTCVVARADLAALLASHDKLVEGLKQAQSVLAEFRNPDITVSAATVFTRIVAAELACRTALGETQ